MGGGRGGEKMVLGVGGWWSGERGDNSDEDGVKVITGLVPLLTAMGWGDAGAMGVVLLLLLLAAATDEAGPMEEEGE